MGKFCSVIDSRMRPICRLQSRIRQALICEAHWYTPGVNTSTAKRLATKDSELRRFLELALAAIPALKKREDARYVQNYVDGLLMGGKTWPRANEDFVTGIEGTLLLIADENNAAREACAMVEQWLRRRGRI